jgi:serine/threonine protein kinase
VAFKILPDVFAQDGDRLARFAREARLLASLNHPNIAQIYGVVESDGRQGIIMELVQGETLHARLQSAPMRIAEALQIARQVAEALEAAHDRGIVHRDLKPGNVMVTADGHTKVLDFGLARIAELQAADIDQSQSPTVFTAATQANVLLGTAAYMSPEQVRGRAADERSDVWAFGCVLYEMLTGRRAFTGETTADLLGSIVHVDPDWKALPADAPPRVLALVKRCLEKDRKKRVHAIGDARIELEEAESAPPVPAERSQNRRSMGFVIAAALLALVGIGALMVSRYLTPRPEPPVATRFLIDMPEESNWGATPVAPYPAVSPDGRYVSFRAGLASRPPVLWIRPISSLIAQPIPGTENVDPGAQPFWSPDSRYIAFIAGGKLKKVAVGGGPSQVLCDATGPGGTWNRDDVILFDSQNSIWRVGAAGGTPAVVRVPDKARNDVASRWPWFLPDGHRFVYQAVNLLDQGRSEIRVGSLDSNDDKGLFPANSRVVYASNHLLFSRAGTLLAQPFDVQRLSLTGDAFPAVSDTIGYAVALGFAAFSASDNGTLVYREEGRATDTELTWFDRAGKQLGLAPVIGHVQRPHVASDQRRIVVERNDNAGIDLWVLDVVRGTSSRFTYDPADELYPVFSPDGAQIAFGSNRGGKFGVYTKGSSGLGAEELIYTVEGASNLGIGDWSPDGKTLLYNVLSTGGTGWDVWGIPMTGDRKAFPLLNEKYNQFRSRFSPDGRFVLYTSDETGRQEVYVQPFPSSGGKWQVSVNGAVDGYWRHDGKEIVFNSIDGQMMAVDVKLGTTFEAGVPHVLFKIPGTIVAQRFVVASDAQRFLLPFAARAGGRQTLAAVLNWTADIKK